MTASPAFAAARAASAIALALALALALAIASVPANAEPHVAPDTIAQLDRQTERVLVLLAAGDTERASVLARQLARRFPRFALGQLLHAELSSLAALDGTRVGSGASWSPALLERLLEARARFGIAVPEGAGEGGAHALAAVTAPAPFLQLGRGVRHLVLAELARSRLSLYEVRDGLAVLVRDHYVASGSAGFGKRREGDLKTPLGLYRIDGFHDDAALPDLYGSGALVLDYPNALDRALGRTGSGIWLHGVPHARRSRAPRSSEGCVTMSNEHFTALRRRIEPDGTLVALLADTATSSASGRGTDGGAAATGSEADSSAARLVHRQGLFRRYRDGHVGHAAERLDAAALAALRELPADAVTIFENPVEDDHDAVALTVMDVRPVSDGATRITLHWAYGERHGWQLVHEDVRQPTGRAASEALPPRSLSTQG